MPLKSFLEGHSRSLKMAPFDRSHTSSIGVPLCCTVSEIMRSRIPYSTGIRRPLPTHRNFYLATRMHSADYAVARRLCVRTSMCPSHAGIVPKHILKVFFYRRVAPPYSFFIPNGMAIFRRGRRMQGGMKKSRFSTNISFCLANDASQSHSYYGRRIGNRTQAFEW